jgi:hypothetical protein
MTLRDHVLVIGLLSLTALLGCSPEQSGVILSTDLGRFRAGDKVEVEFQNESGESVGTNVCFAFFQLQKNAAEGWEPISADLWPAPNTACTSELRLMPPGTRVSSPVYLPDDLPSGTYRLALNVEVDGDRRKIATDGFRVR